MASEKVVAFPKRLAPDLVAAAMRAFDLIARLEADSYADGPWSVFGLRLGRHVYDGSPKDPHGTREAMRTDAIARMARLREIAEKRAIVGDWPGFLLVFGGGWRRAAMTELRREIGDPEARRDVLRAWRQLRE